MILTLRDLTKGKTFEKTFETEFERDKFVRKLKFSKKLIIIGGIKNEQ